MKTLSQVSTAMPLGPESSTLVAKSGGATSGVAPSVPAALPANVEMLRPTPPSPIVMTRSLFIVGSETYSAVAALLSASPTGDVSSAERGGPPSPTTAAGPGVLQAPAKRDTIPDVMLMRRTTCAFVSAIKRRFAVASKATPAGALKPALSAGPPLP